MRYLGIAAVAVLLAGCGAAEISDLRAPQNPDETAQVREQFPRISRVAPRLSIANTDLCAPRNRCVLIVNVNIASRPGAFSTRDGIYVSVPLLKALKNDDELAGLVGHEWSHRILGHVDGASLPKDRENEADCVGAAAAFRAGYSVDKVADSVARVAGGVEFEQNALMMTKLVLLGAIPSGGDDNHPDASDRASYIRKIGADLTARKARGETIDATTIVQVCGVRF